jgi:DNA-binding response OmpR family regulator
MEAYRDSDGFALGSRENGGPGEGSSPREGGATQGGGTQYGGAHESSRPREPDGGLDRGGTLYAGELEIRLGEGLVLATGRALTLSVREFELLVAMAKRSGAIVTREELYGAVWGADLRAGDRSVDVYVSKLRGKLEAAMPDRRFIHTHPGFGYRFQPQPSRNVHTQAVAL